MRTEDIAGFVALIVLVLSWVALVVFVSLPYALMLLVPYAVLIALALTEWDGPGDRIRDWMRR